MRPFGLGNRLGFKEFLNISSHSHIVVVKSLKDLNTVKVHLCQNVV